MKAITTLLTIVVFIFIYYPASCYYKNKIIWIPCSGKGTVVAVDDSSYQVLGEYLTAPPSVRDSASPSRYAINYNGDVIFGHRMLGAITILKYKKGAGIHTSTRLGDLKAWPETGPEDEAIVKYIPLPKFGDTRHISVTADKKIIVGSTWVPNFFYILDGTSYEIIDSITGACSGGYGGLTVNEYLWSVSKNQSKTLRHNMNTGEEKCFDLNMSYGITSLPSGSVYNTLYNDKAVCKLSPNSDNVIDTFAVRRTARGLTYNPYNERLYIANSLEDYITEMDTLGNITDSINLSQYLVMQTPPFRDPTGILVNNYDILVTCFYQDTILVYNTLTNTMKAKIPIGPAANPYFYNSTTNLSFLYPEIVTVDTMNFYRELCENERSDFITITNDGFADLHVYSYKIEGANASRFNLTTGQFPFTLKPNESKNLAVWTYRPTTPGEISAVLKLYSDAINSDVDSSISVILHSEFQKIEHVLEGITSDTVFFGDIPQDSFIDTTLSVRNFSSIASYIIVKLNGDARFTMLTDTLFEMDLLELANIVVRFNSQDMEDGWYYADLTIQDECRTQKITLAASIHCQPQVLTKDTIIACRSGEDINFQPYYEDMNVTPPIDSVIIIDGDGNRFTIDKPVAVESSMNYTIFAWSNGCWTSKTFFVEAPDFDYVEEEYRFVIPGNPIVIGPNVDWKSIFSTSNIDFIWSPRKGIIYEFENGMIAVDPDTSTIYHLQIVVDSKCNFAYRCDVELSPCSVKDNLISNGLVRIYPNPANDELTIDFKEYLFTTPIALSVVNTLGMDMKKFVLSHYALHNKIFISDLPQGSYMLRIQAGNDWINIGAVMIYR